MNNDVTTLQIGRGFIIGSGETYTVKAGKELTFYQVNLKVTRFDQGSNLVDPLLRCKGEINCAPFAICLDLLEFIYKHREAKGELDRFQNYIKIQELLLFICRQNELSTFEQNISQTVDESIDYLNQNYQHPLTIESLATMMNVSRWQYTKFFKEKTGEVPSRYLNTIRIKKAKQLLLMTDDSLQVIADHIGFSNEYYFNRRFKQIVGVTPGQYRRNHQQNIRVFAPFLEDFLLALGITPVAQIFHEGWGKQNYLNLLQIPIVDVMSKDNLALSKHKPDFIVIEYGIDRWIPIDWFQQVAPTYKLSLPGEQWREMLRTVADLFGYIDKAEAIISEYERKARQAKQVLRHTMKNQTVAFLRISTKEIELYAGSDYGFTGPILYKDLGLKFPAMVKHLIPKVRKVELSLEDLHQLDADHLFITRDCIEGEKMIVFDDPVWQTLRAVKNNHVYEVDFFTWMNYGVLSHFKKIDDVLSVFG